MERQSAWMQAIQSPDSMHGDADIATLASAGWSGGIRSREAGFAVYVNNVRATLREALAMTYPLCCDIVGKPGFNRAVIAMLEQHPPTTADLGEYGEQFADVLYVMSVPAIGIDAARCEWLVDQLPRRPTEAAWHIEAAAVLPPHDWLSLPLRLVPQCAVLSSAYDLAALFSEKGTDAGIIARDMASAHPLYFCLVAGPDGVAVQPIPAQAYALATTLDGRIGLEAVTEQLLCTDPEFNVFAAVASLLAIAAVSAPSLPTSTAR